MKQKELDDLWKSVEEYVEALRSQIPFVLLLSHGYKIDDRKEFAKLMKIFKQKKKK